MKRIIVICAICVTMLAAMPIVSHAQTGAVQSERLAAEPDGFCHCGARREKVQQLSVYLGVCSQHGADSGCTFFASRYYYYCTNPNCGDNWYSAWEVYKVEHGE